jgi:acyl dehydratase
MDDGVYLEELQVGQRYESGKRIVTAEDIKRFAAEFDPQPFHLDDAAAAKTMFGGLAASGWHTAALTMRLLVDSSAPTKGGVVGAGVELAWTRPVRPGDELQVFSEIVEITPSRSKPDRGIALLRSETRNQKGEVVQVMTSKLVVPRKPQAA